MLAALLLDHEQAGAGVCLMYTEEMMSMRITSLGLPVALFAASLFSACNNTARGVEQDTAENTAKIKAESREAEAKGSQAGADAKQAAEHAAEATKNAVADAADATRNAADRAATATKDAAHDMAQSTKEGSAEAGEKARNAAHATGAAIDGAAQTLQIKTALMADKTVDASDINVDTNGSTKTVTLNGSVKTNAERTAAARIAKEKAPDYRIVNRLTVK